jgi:ABC-type thiamin/hydroxymethylpyrimidine transport system permease subunit
LVQIVTGPLFIPGGSIAGGIYMLFIILGYAIVKKRFTALLICLVQAILVTVTGSMGTHGILSLITYVVPGIGVEILYLIIGRKVRQGRNISKGACFAGGVVANTIGTALVNLVFFRLPVLPLMLVLASGALSGGLGGLLAYALARQVNKINPDHKKDKESETDIDEQPLDAEQAGGPEQAARADADERKDQGAQG